MMTSYTQPDFVQIWWKEISQPIWIRNVWYLAVTFYSMCSSIWALQFCYHGNILGSRSPHIRSFFGHLCRSILVFVNSTSYAWTNCSIFIQCLLIWWKPRIYFETAICWGLGANLAEIVQTKPIDESGNFNVFVPSVWIWSLCQNLLVTILKWFCYSDEDKQAFEAWHAHDDAEDNFCELDGELWFPVKCEKWTDQQDASVEQRNTLSPRQESNPWPPEHQAGALSTELQELVENKVI